MARLLLCFRLALLGAALFTFAMAVAPPGAGPELLPWDKAQHFLAFYVLAVLGAAAFPRQAILIPALALVAFGGLIELVQALPFVGRDAEVGDWLADGVGVLFALAPLGLARWRAQVRAERDQKSLSIS